MDFVYAGIGLVILLLAGDALVRGAVNTSLRLGVPALIVSLTIVAFGTSAPELLIAIRAIFDDAPGLALGNVVGSNTANVLLVLGVPALFAGLTTKHFDAMKSYVLMLGATALFIALCFMGPLTWVHGLILLAALAFVLGDQLRDALAHRKQAKADEDLGDVEGADPNMPWWKIGLFTVLGLVGLPIGAELLVQSSVSIATDFGVSDTVIGLTLVAIGTSLPELATTVMAAVRKQADVAIGNVIGSNMFNLLAIIGIANLFGSIPVDPQFLSFDLWIMLGTSLLLLPFVCGPKWNLTKPWGAGFTALYVAYLVIVIM